MKKMYFSILLTVLMSMVGAKAFAYDVAVENADGVTICYNFINDSTELEVASGGGYAGNIVIPDSVVYNDSTYQVTSIGYYAFSSCRDLTGVTIPNSVIAIQGYVFERCYNLTSITIPDNVKYLDGYIFSNCTSLTKVTIGNGVTSVGNGIFSGCSSLTDITIGSGVIGLGGSIFGNASSLPSQVSMTLLCAAPPKCYGSSFGTSAAIRNKVYENVTLHVLAGSKEAYQQTDPWKNFLNIEDDVETGIEPVVVDKHSKNDIYTLNGTKLQTTNVADLPKGIYIVNGKKVVVK